MSFFDSTPSNLTPLCSVVFRKTHAGFQVDHWSLHLRYYFPDTPTFLSTSASLSITTNVIDVDEINDTTVDDGHGVETPATPTSARRCRWVASAPTRPSRPLDPFSASNYSQSAYAGSSKGKGGPSSKGGKGGVSSRKEFAGVVPIGRVVMSGATTGLEMLERALAGWPVPESTKGGGPPACIEPKICELYGPTPPGDVEYYREQCSSLEQSDTHSNSSNEWVHEEWLDSDKDLACYTGYDD